MFAFINMLLYYLTDDQNIGRMTNEKSNGNNGTPDIFLR